MVLVGGGLSGGLLGLFLTSEDHPNPLPWVAVCAAITMALLTLALWPRR